MSHFKLMAFVVLTTMSFSCNKNTPVTAAIQDDAAKIIVVGYACGTACDAAGYVIRMSDSSIYNPDSLPADFRVSSLLVKVTYRRTGKLPAVYAGPQYEQIVILQISR